MDNLNVIRATPNVALTTIEDIDAIGPELSEEHLHLVAGGMVSQRPDGGTEPARQTTGGVACDA
jgi:hypothetical protein